VFLTDADLGYCHDHSASIHSHKCQMRQKAKAEAEAEALQLAKTSELSVRGEQKILFYPVLEKLFEKTGQSCLIDSQKVECSSRFSQH